MPTESPGSDRGIIYIVENAKSDLDRGFSPLKTLAGLSHDWGHLVQVTRDKDLRAVVVKLAFLRGLIGSYVRDEVRTRSVKALDKLDTTDAVKDMLRGELPSITEDHFDMDLVPDYSQLCKDLTTLTGIEDPSTMKAREVFLAKATDTVMSVLASVGREMRRELTEQVAEFLGQVLRDSGEKPLSVFEQNLDAMIDKFHKSAYGW